MLAIEITEPGGPDVLRIVERPVPIPNDNEVLIQTVNAGINRPDILQRLGQYPPPQGTTDILGLEVSGLVCEVGKYVENLKPGDQVCALLTGGGYAEFCLAHKDLCLPIPKGMTFPEAAALPETFFTVWSNVFQRAVLQPKEILLVHGGSSGIGTTAIQLAKAFEAEVIVTVGSEEKKRFTEQLGADLAINYKNEDFVEAVLSYTDNKGLDVILDMIGGDYFPRNIKCMNNDARLVQIAIQHGPKTELNLLPVMLKRLTITGSTLRARSVEFKAQIAKNLLKHVWPLLESGTIKPVIHAAFPLDSASLAHQIMESSSHMGKIILSVSHV